MSPYILSRQGKLLMMLLRLAQYIRLMAQLTRPLPVLAWSGCAMLLGAAAAPPGTPRPWGPLLCSLISVVLLHGVTAHALNDVADWRSGTDHLSPNLLSGGSGVLRRGLSLLRLMRWSQAGAMLATAMAAYLAVTISPWLLLFYAIGLWAAIAYSHPPWRLAYRPLVGEWLAAWPSAFAVVVATTLLWSGTITATAAAAAAAHATLSIAWLMQHHLPDIDADLAAVPIKLTTPAAAAVRWGRRAAVIPGLTYYLLALAWGLYCAGVLNRAFFVTAAAASAGVFFTLAVRPADARHTTALEIIMILLAMGHAFVLALWLP